MGNIAPAAGIKPVSLTFQASVLTITLADLEEGYAQQKVSACLSSTILTSDWQERFTPEWAVLWDGYVHQKASVNRCYIILRNLCV